MATGTALLTIEEYLKTVYRPDCDFVDGELEERIVVEHDQNRKDRHRPPRHPRNADLPRSPRPLRGTRLNEPSVRGTTLRVPHVSILRRGSVSLTAPSVAVSSR